jgi:arylformamidase
MTLYDASLPIRQGMLTFPGDPPFNTETVFSRRKGDRFNLASLSMSTHLGTHVDPPAHYLDGGGTVDRIPLEILIGPGVVLDMTGRGEVDAAALEASPLAGHIRVLLKTDNSAKLNEPEFQEDYAYLTEDGADFLVRAGVRMVGIDYLSIEQYVNEGAPVHTALLKAGVLVVESLYLGEVPAGPCEIYCLPLLLENGDGAPARVLIRTQS